MIGHNNYADRAVLAALVARLHRATVDQLHQDEGFDLVAESRTGTSRRGRGRFEELAQLRQRRLARDVEFDVRFRRAALPPFGFEVGGASRSNQAETMAF